MGYDPKVDGERYWELTDGHMPRGVTMSRKGRSERVAAQTQGERVVEVGCVDVSKREVWYAKQRVSYSRWLIEPLLLLPEHDFSRDKRYLELSRKLTYFDIELSKHIASGDTVHEIQLSMFVQRQASRITQRLVGSKIRRRETLIAPLVSYFKNLMGSDRDPTSFSVEEAFLHLVNGIRQAKDGKEKSDLTYKLLDICGMGEKLKEYAKSRITGEEFEMGLTLEDARKLVDS